MRVDAHQHFWDLSRFPYAWMPPDPSPLRRNFLPPDLAPILDANHFDGSVVVQATTVPEEARWLLGLADEHVFIKGVVAWVDLTADDAGQQLDRLQRHPKLKGIRHPVHDEADDEWLLREDVVRGLREVARRELTYDLLLRPRHLRLVPELAERVPNLRLVIDHIAKPQVAEARLEGWAEHMARVSQIPQVFVKLSGMITEADRKNWTAEHLKPFVNHVLGLFGPERCMFGSDWPVCLEAGRWKEVLAAFTQAVGPAPVETRAKLLGETAARFYRL